MTPPSSGRKRKRAVSQAGLASVKRALFKSGAKAVGRAVPGVGTALAAYDVYKQLSSGFSSKPKSANKRIAGRDYTKGKRITRNKRQRMTVFDRIIGKGFVYKLQSGNVLSTSNPVGYLAQSTMPGRTLARVLWTALLKKIFAIAGIHVKNVNDILTENQYYNGSIEIRYKLKDGELVTNSTFTVSASSTTISMLEDLINTAFVNFTEATLPQQFLSLRYYVEFGQLAAARLLMADMDLTNTYFTVNAKSEMKFQNRTINSTGNDQADDVDNVPLEGKFFDYNTNSTLYRDYGVPTGVTGPSAITTDGVYGVLSTLVPSTLGGSMYTQLPLKSQFVGVKGTGNFVIQPGKIRNSVLYDKMTIGFNKFINLIYLRFPASGGVVGSYSQVWCGKSRLHGFEKEMQPTSFNADNVISVAWEHSVTVGAVCHSKQSIQTAPQTVVVPSVTVN